MLEIVFLLSGLARSSSLHDWKRQYIGERLAQLEEEVAGL